MPRVRYIKGAKRDSTEVGIFPFYIFAKRKFLYDDEREVKSSIIIPCYVFMYKSYNISIRRSMIAPRGLVIVLASKYDFHLGSINPCAFFFLLSSSFPSQITKNYIFLFPSSFFPACCSSKRRNRKKKFRPTRDSRKKIPGVKIKLATFYWFVKVRRCR